jgi:hypothetical protein
MINSKKPPDRAIEMLPSGRFHGSQKVGISVICSLCEEGMSGRYLEYRGRPVPGAGSRPVTVLLVLVWAGVGEGHRTCEAG